MAPGSFCSADQNDGVSDIVTDVVSDVVTDGCL